MPIIVITVIVLFTVFLKIHSKHKKPAKTAIVNMILGVLSLVLIAPIVSAPINIYTVFVALTLGVSGTVLVLLLL